MPRPGLCREDQNDEAWKAHTNLAATAYACVQMRHSPEGKSELFQECQQFVVGLKALGSSFDGVGLGQGLFFQCEISIEIDLSGFHRFVAQPKCNHGAIHAGLKQFHRGGVPQDMRGYALLSQGSAVFPRLGHVTREQVLNAISAQGSTSCTGEQRFGISSPLLPNPCAEDRDRGFGQRGTAFLSPFAPAVYMCASAQRDIVLPQRGHLGQAQAGLHGGEQEGMVTTSHPSRSIRRCQQRFNLWPREETHQGTWLSLVGNGQHALYDSALRRRLQRGIPEE